MRRALTLLPCAALCTLSLIAQSKPTAAANKEAASQQAASQPAASDSGDVKAAPLTQKIQWPQDRDRIVCSVNGQKYSAADMLGYIEANHWPGLLKFLELRSGRDYFKSPLMARWVRQFADITALRIAAEQRGIDMKKAQEILGEALKLGFERWLSEYREARRRGGNDRPLTQTSIDNLLSTFQKQSGLETELGGWLGILVPLMPVKEGELLRDYYAENARSFGGRVTAAQILVRHRDPISGELYVGTKRRQALKKLRDVQDRLAADGSNFEEIARLLSDDHITGPDGGILRNIKRFDPLLPAAVCRAVWTIPDGRTKGPFESPYGFHFVKRLSFMQEKFVIYNDRVAPEIAGTKRTHEQELLLFGLRDALDVKLHY